MGLTTIRQFDSLRNLMHAHGVTCSPEEFRRAVNVTFHDCESVVYDQVHESMWKSLPGHFMALSDRMIDAGIAGGPLRLLDIGSGTGLSVELLLRTEVGKRIGEVHLVDTSPGMIKRVLHRSRAWNVRTVVHETTIEAFSAAEEYDLVMACSLLHHIPDLCGVFHSVSGLQRPGSFFLHLQDPNGDYLDDPQLKERTARAARRLGPKVNRFVHRLSPRQVVSKIARELMGAEPEDYIARTNRELLASGIIRSRMSAEEIWSVTDVHVYDGLGISIERMKSELIGYRLLMSLASGFFGHMASELPTHLRREEERLVAQGAPNGHHIAGLWQRI